MSELSIAITEAFKHSQAAVFAVRLKNFLTILLFTHFSLAFTNKERVQDQIKLTIICVPYGARVAVRLGTLIRARTKHESALQSWTSGSQARPLSCTIRLSSHSAWRAYNYAV